MCFKIVFDFGVNFAEKLLLRHNKSLYKFFVREKVVALILFEYHRVNFLLRNIAQIYVISGHISLEST